MPIDLPPGVVLLLAAAVAAVVPARLRPLVLCAAPLLAGWALLAWPAVGTDATAAIRVQLAGLDLVPCRIDGLAATFAGVFCLAILLAGLFSAHVRERLPTVAALAYGGAAVGAVTAGDLVSLFVHVELMSVAGALLIWVRGGPRALRAGWRYLLWQLAAGFLLLAGALLQARQTGDLALTRLTLDDPGAPLLLAAFGIKAGFPLLHTWITDAYPESTATGTVWLSALTTKVGVYALARTFAGTEALVVVGVVMACFPIFYAVIENDLRRVLAYSLVNQVGFMVCGIGIGTELALAGTVAHACTDTVFKGLLFMAMGAVLHRTGRIGGDGLGGLWRSMPWTTAACLVGAASISAFPLFSGFVSKSMIMSAALAEGHGVAWLLLLFASAGVFHHAGIKIPFFAFFAHDSGLRPAEAPRNMLAAMLLAAAICVAVGCMPSLLYDRLPFAVDYDPYDGTHVVAQLQLLLWSSLAFVWLRRTGLYPPELPSVNLDADWLLRRALPRTGTRLVAAVARPLAALRTAAVGGAGRIWRLLLRHNGPRSPIARSHPTDSMLLWTAVLLGLMLLLYFR